MTEPRQAGFSLVEMLVSLALLALISLVLLQAIGTAGLLSRLGGRLAAEADLDIVRDHLRVSLGRLAGRQANGTRPAFRGEPQRFTAMILANRDAERGGEVVQTVWVARREDGRLDLLASRNLRSGSGEGVPEILVRRVVAARLRYFGNAVTESLPRWHENWTRRDRPPALIEITLGFPPGDPRRWPPLLVPLGAGQ